MPLLSIVVSKKVPIALSLEESTAKLTDAYAMFAKVPADEVVNSALEYVFEKDKDFQKWREGNPSAQIPASLKLQSEAAEAPANGRGKRSQNGSNAS